MSTTATFEWAAARVEALFRLSRMESRGTLRHVLRDVGLDPNAVTAAQLTVAIYRVLPGALRKCGVADPDVRCHALASEVGAAAGAGAGVLAPEDVFARLGRR